MTPQTEGDYLKRIEALEKRIEQLTTRAVLAERRAAAAEAKLPKKQGATRFKTQLRHNDGRRKTVKFTTDRPLMFDEEEGPDNDALWAAAREVAGDWNIVWIKEDD